MRRTDAKRRAATWLIQTPSLLLFLALEGRLAQRTLQGVTDTGALLSAALALPLALLLTDFISGLVHWLCDNFFAEDTPILGAALIQPFREHHRDPLAITRHGFLERNHANTLSVLPILAWGALHDASDAGGRAEVFAHAFLTCFGLAVALTNQIHGWAHAPRVPRGIRLLQRAGLLLHPRHHARHHRHGMAYCITGGWLDAPLERFRFFETLERAVGRARSS